MDPLPRPTAPVRTEADLAFAHLQAIRSRLPEAPEEVILVVPGTLDPRQLGLLLGMAETLQLPVSGMVDTAVAATARPFPEGTLAHISLHLEQTVLTTLSQGQSVQRARVDVLPGLGRLALEDVLAQGIADRFVDGTRFDPLRLPDTEQALYDGLPGWLETLAGAGELELTMEAGGRSHQLQIGAQEMTAMLGPHLNRLSLWVRGLLPPGTATSLQVCGQLARFPGLEAALHQQLAPCQIVPLSPEAPCERALRDVEAIRSSAEDPRLITALPWAEPVPEPAPFAAPGPGPADSLDPRRVPTHVLYRGLAYPLGDSPLAVGRDPPAQRPRLQLVGALAGISRLHCELSLRGGRAWVEDRSTYGLRLNGARIATRGELRAGDLLDLGGPGQELQLITVIEPDATP